LYTLHDPIDTEHARALPLAALRMLSPSILIAIL